MSGQGQRKSTLNPSAVMAWVIVLVLHGGMLLWLLRPVVAGAKLLSTRATDSSPRLQLRFLTSPSAKRWQRGPQAAVAATRPSRTRVRLSVRAVVSVAPQAGVSGPASFAASVSLFNPDGSIRIPGQAPQLRAADAADMRHFQQLPCHGTRFSANWARGQDESLGNEVARKYLSVIGLYNHETEAAYQKRREYLDEACAH
jgi:hypothetical protein